MSNKINRRFYSLDLTRGLIVILSVFLSNIPYGGYEYLRHKDWYGVTIIDFILPAFITIFGTGMAFAYQKGVHWGELTKRTIRLIIYGLLFNMIVMWEFNLEMLRFTGVLQLYAVLGIFTVIITRFSKKPIYLLGIVLTILFLHGSLLLSTSADCQSGLPQPECNPSGVIDQAIFGADHMYVNGTRGYDPEGVLTMFASLSNVLIGYIAGLLLLKKRQEGRYAWKELIISGCIIIILSLVISQFLPFNKRIWTPSFALLTAGSTIGLLGILHILFDKGKSLAGPVIIIEAYGRNSFLIYFGKFIVASLMTHITIKAGEETLSISQILYRWVENTIPFYPQLMYAFIILLIWTIVVMILYKKKWYLKV